MDGGSSPHAPLGRAPLAKTSGGAAAALVAASAAGMAAAGRPLEVRGGEEEDSASVRAARCAELMADLEDACDGLEAVMGTAAVMMGGGR